MHKKSGPYNSCSDEVCLNKKSGGQTKYSCSSFFGVARTPFSMIETTDLVYLYIS